MTEKDNTEIEGVLEEEKTEEENEPQRPSLRTFRVTTLREVEIDFSDRQLEALTQQTGADSAEEAIEQIFFQRATQTVEPEQKLTQLDTNADETSNQ